MKTIAGLVLGLIALPTFAGITAIRAGVLVDPARGTVTRDQVILVEDGRIKAVQGSSAALPAGIPVIDRSKEWVLPGLIDAHTHLTLTELEGNAPFESFYIKETTGFRAMRGLYNAGILLRAGFTTIRDIGNSGEYAMQDVKHSIENGWFVGPTIIDSGKIITPFGGQSHGIPPEQGTFWKYEYLDADTPDEIRKAVRQNLYYGAGVIKLVLDNGPYHYTAADIRVAIEEAHRAGVAVSVHTYGGAAADEAIEAGVDSIEHGFFLTDTQLERMKKKGIALVSTDFPRTHLDVIGTSGGIFPEPSVLAPRIIDRLERAHRIGVTLVFGTDTVMERSGASRPDLMFDYLAVWRSAGIPAMDLLRAMTNHAATLLGLGSTRGSVAPGYAADLIALPEDPLANTEALRRVDFVMKDGHVIKDSSSPEGAR